ncbi:MAG TPA: ribonuclease HII [Anaerolineae bacterium]|nr:ribonuclease HII [Anaerolineae bacterium]
MAWENSIPTLTFENRLWNDGYRYVAGLDEAGRGAWAGPVVAAAVILPPDEPALAEYLAGVRDSKRLTSARREALQESIQQVALTWGVGAVSPAEIDSTGIVAATRKAMALALQTLSPAAEYLLIDYLSLPDVALPQKGLPKGDARVLSIAAASIVAKVSRDRIMVNLDAELPGYGFGQHKGYGTVYHQTTLETLGPSPIHRLSFAPVERVAAQRQG